ncbi:MAG: MlaD family protein [Syntrophales bacterium]
MELNFSKREKIVGLFMIGIALLLLATVFAIGRGKDWFKSYVHYYTVFDESYNLNVNAAVKLSKADIGKVKKISLYGDRVKVEIAVLKDYSSRIRADSQAAVESPTLIGSEYVSIKPGSPKAPAIAPGGEIPSRAKKSIEDVLAEFQVEQTAKKVIQAVQDLSEIVEKMHDPDGPLFSAMSTTNKILAHIENVTRDIKDGKGPVGGVLKSDKLLKSIHQDMEKIDRILVHIEKTTEKTPEIMENLRTSVQNIREIVSNVEKGSRDIPEVTRATKRGISEVRDGVKNIDSVVQSIRQNPLIRPNLPPEPKGENVDAGLRK